MNKKLLLTLLPLTFLIAACSGGSQPTPSSSNQPADPSSSNQPADPSSSANSSADPASSVEDPVDSSSVEDPDESSSDVEDPVTPDLSAHYVTLGEADPIYLYQDETYDPLTDIWSGAAAKFTTGPIDVTAGESILVTAVNDDETTTSVYANGFNANNNVEGTGPDGYTVKTTAEDAVLDLYQYADGGWAFNLSGASQDDPVDPVDPVIPDSALFTVPSNWNAETIYVYAWSGEGDDLTKNGEWPGVQLSDPTTNGYGETQYAITIGDYTNFIISDGTNQTVDLLASQLAGKSGCYCDGTKDSSGHYNLLFW